MSESTKDVYRAICQVAKEISKDGIAKGKKNEQQGYKFRGIDDIYNALSAVISGAELCILPRMADRTQEERETAKGGVLFYVTVRADFDFVSARDGSIHTVTMYGEAMDSADKATNKAMSAAYKYACLQVFCIPTESMDDADAHTPEPTAKANASKVAQQKIDQMKQGVPYSQTKTDVDISMIPDAPVVESPTSIKAVLAQFSKMKEHIGEEEYYRILGLHKYTHANEIRSLDEKRRIYKEMAFRAYEIEQQRGELAHV